jgi:hypothetical protein
MAECFPSQGWSIIDIVPQVHYDRQAPVGQTTKPSTHCGINLEFTNKSGKLFYANTLEYFAHGHLQLVILIGHSPMVI